jgi:flagellar biosynthesis protein FliR
VFEAVQLAGQVLGIQMGYSLVNILDPQTQVDTTVIPLFYQTMSCCCFCAWMCTTGCCARWATALSICRRVPRT